MKKVLAVIILSMSTVAGANAFCQMPMMPMMDFNNPSQNAVNQQLYNQAQNQYQMCQQMERMEQQRQQQEFQNRMNSMNSW